MRAAATGARAGADLMNQVILDNDARLGAAGLDLDTAHRRVVNVKTVDHHVGNAAARPEPMLARAATVDDRQRCRVGLIRQLAVITVMPDRDRVSCGSMN